MISWVQLVPNCWGPVEHNFTSGSGSVELWTWPCLDVIGLAKFANIYFRWLDTYNFDVLGKEWHDVTLVSEDGDVSDWYIGILSNGAKEVLAFNTSNEHSDVEGKGAGASLLIRICSYKLTKAWVKLYFNNAWSKNTIFISSEGDKLRGTWRQERSWTLELPLDKGKESAWMRKGGTLFKLGFVHLKSTLSLSQSIFITMHDRRTQFTFLAKVASWEEFGGESDVGASIRHVQREHLEK